MSTYKNVLVAVDLTQSAEHVVKRALPFAKNTGVILRFIHVVDYIPYMGFGEGALINPTYTLPREEQESNAREPLQRLFATLEVNNPELIIEFGTAATEIVRFAEENNTDLIVLGSHGRHGVKLLLGSTANAVLHHAKCDVLAVRIED